MIDECHSLDVKLAQDLLSCLLYCIMIYFHLLGEVFFKPVILFYVIVDEFDGQLPVYLYCRFSFL